MDLDRRPDGFIQPVDGRERQAGHSGTDDHGRHKHMQPVEAAGGDEGRDRAGTAFHQNFAQPAPEEGSAMAAGGMTPSTAGTRISSIVGRPAAGFGPDHIAIGAIRGHAFGVDAAGGRLDR